LRHQEFNSILLEAIDESIRELLGQRVLESLYSVLEKRHDVTRDELPYRLETAYKLLDEVFGIQATRTISNRIIRQLYQKLNLEFEDTGSLDLLGYVEIAKKKLAQSGLSGGH